MTQYARYTVIVDRELGETDYIDSHHGDGVKAVAQLAGELQEAWDATGVGGHYQITERRIVDDEGPGYVDLNALPREFDDDPRKVRVLKRIALTDEEGGLNIWVREAPDGTLTVDLDTPEAGPGAPKLVVNVDDRQVHAR